MVILRYPITFVGKKIFQITAVFMAIYLDLAVVTYFTPPSILSQWQNFNKVFLIWLCYKSYRALLWLDCDLMKVNLLISDRHQCTAHLATTYICPLYILKMNFTNYWGIFNSVKILIFAVLLFAIFVVNIIAWKTVPNWFLTLYKAYHILNPWKC